MGCCRGALAQQSGGDGGSDGEEGDNPVGEGADALGAIFGKWPPGIVGLNLAGDAINIGNPGCGAEKEGDGEKAGEGVLGHGRLLSVADADWAAGAVLARIYTDGCDDVAADSRG